MRTKGHVTANRVRGHSCARVDFSPVTVRGPPRKMAETHGPPVFSPKTLYQLSVLAIANKFLSLRKYLPDLPNDVLFDVYYQVNGTSSRGFRVNIDLSSVSLFFFFISYINLTKNFSTILVLLFRFCNELFALPASFIGFVVLIPVKSRV